MKPKYDLTRGIINPESEIAAAKLLDQHSASIIKSDLLNYSAPETQLPGFVPLKQTIARWHKINHPQPAQFVYITNGGMNANSIVFEGIRVRQNQTQIRSLFLTDRYLYDRALQKLVNDGFLVVGVPLDDKGPIPSALETLIHKYEPSGFWTQPEANNPTGLRYSRERLSKVADICASTSTILVIDDAYQNSSLRSDRKVEPIDLSRPEFKTTIVTKNNTKELAPGIKTGYIAMNPRLKSLTGVILQNIAPTNILNGHYGLQAAWYKLIESRDYENHIIKTNVELHKPRGDMVNKFIKDHCPTNEFTSHGVTDGGYFTMLWIKNATMRTINNIVESASTYKEGVALQSGLTCIAPVDPDSQPTLVDYTLTVSPFSPHTTPIISEMGAAPLRLAFNHTPSLDALAKSMTLAREVIGYVMAGQQVPK